MGVKVVRIEITPVKNGVKICVKPWRPKVRKVDRLRWRSKSAFSVQQFTSGGKSKKSKSHIFDAPPSGNSTADTGPAGGNVHTTSSVKDDAEAGIYSYEITIPNVLAGQDLIIDPEYEYEDDDDEEEDE